MVCSPVRDEYITAELPTQEAGSLTFHYIQWGALPCVTLVSIPENSPVHSLLGAVYWCQ
jgi:hypothetical protein